MSQTLLEVEHLGVVLDGRPVVEDVTFRVGRGESVAVVGPNGAGKTMLLRALVGVIPHTGKLVLAPGLRMGYVPQRVEADRSLPLCAEDLLRAKARILGVGRARVDEVARLTGLSREVLRAPVGHLSGGQLQAAMVAFALLGRPELVLLDEPTASLDRAAEAHVLGLIEDLVERFALATVTVSHDLEQVRDRADKVLCLNRRAICFGVPAEVLSPGALDEILRGPAPPGAIREAAAVTSPAAIVLAILAAAAAGAVGAFAQMRRMALAGDAVSHVALPGLGIALLAGVEPLAGAAAALVGGTLLIWALERRTRLETEAVVGVVFSGALALGALVTPTEDLIEALFGGSKAPTPGEFAAAAALGLGVLLVLLRSRHALLLHLFSGELAAATGLSRARLDLLFLFLFSTTVLLGLRFLGALLAGALVVIPAATARLWTQRLTSFLVASCVSSAATMGAGIALAALAGVAAGPTVVCLSAAGFLVSLAVRPRVAAAPA
ncbi:MAG: metal ABC transporter permease [Myxococcales bacterium]